MDPLTQSLLAQTFPKAGYALKLLDYPAQGQATYVCVNNIETSQFDYLPTSGGSPVTVVAGTPSTYSSNVLNQLLPVYGHLYLVVPTVMPYDLLYQPSSVPAAGDAAVITGQDANTRVLNFTTPSTTVGFVLARESLRMRLHQPPTIPWWGIDSQQDGGAVDWLMSSPETPNPAFLWAITDSFQVGNVIQMQFEMPTNNLAGTVGAPIAVRFYLAFISYRRLAEAPKIYDVVPTYPPQQGQQAQASPSAQIAQAATQNPRAVS
ncbi:MAG TPA: hypothetical protein VMG99_08735 [Thermoplasmata archaeon]|nr:hypothetical protein [Thermoplasmata archaeon]